MLKKILLALAAVMLALQFFRPAKNIARGPSPGDILAHHPASPEVRHLLEVACYDCHSNTTHYPWYAEVQPLGWWLAKHVRDGKRHLNFSEFAAYPPQRAGRKMGQTIDQLTDHTMPLRSYTLIHRDARLTEAQIKLLTDWAEDVQSAYPSDK